MLLNERVPRAVLEQLEEMSVASSVLATYHGDENGSVQTTQIKVQLDPELGRYFNTRRACTKIG